MSSSTTLSSAGVGVESSAAGFPITYQCDSVIEKNPKTEDVEVSYYYELQFLSSVGAAFALEEFESNLLTLVSTSYGYDTGSVCTNIAEQGIWLVRVSSLPKDEENRLIGKKHKATKARNACCDAILVLGDDRFDGSRMDLWGVRGQSVFNGVDGVAPWMRSIIGNVVMEHKEERSQGKGTNRKTEATCWELTDWFVRYHSF